jgi:hypothetical protein
MRITGKKEIIDFHSFMDGSFRKPVSKNVSFSFIPVPTFSSMFLNEPVLIIAGIGLVIIGLSIYEKYLVKKGKEYEAELLSMIVGVGLPTGAVIGAVWVLSYASKLFL